MSRQVTVGVTIASPRGLVSACHRYGDLAIARNQAGADDCCSRNSIAGRSQPARLVVVQGG